MTVLPICQGPAEFQASLATTVTRMITGGSLNPDSASRVARTRGLIGSRRMIEKVAAASVDPTTAPSRSAVRTSTSRTRYVIAASVAITAAITYLVLDVDVRTALLLGAVVGSTDAAATFSIMRRLPIKPRVRATLEAESGFNDPPVIILVTVVASDAWNSAGPWQIGSTVIYQLAAGVIIGLTVARLGQWLLARSALPFAGLYLSLIHI